MSVSIEFPGKNHWYCRVHFARIAIHPSGGMIIYLSSVTCCYGDVAGSVRLKYQYVIYV